MIVGFRCPNCKRFEERSLNDCQLGKSIQIRCSNCKTTWWRTAPKKDAPYDILPGWVEDYPWGLRRVF